ncbi:hypothetical protein C8J57DRAFT_1210950 [Mycena rebaudengoi]|nr:hypothetical protein C8J57DRAFT_1210950 [Mycena rebaudengoi]
MRGSPADRTATNRQLEKYYVRKLREGEYERDTSKAIESSLLAQVEDLTSKIALLEEQVIPLRNELAKYQHTSNPLPAPPEPVPLDRFPPFVRLAAEGGEDYNPYFTPTSFVAPTPPEFAQPVEPARPDKGKGKAKQPYSIYQQVSRANGNVIIPGATPSARVIPTSETNGHAYHTHIPATAYVDGYADGYGLGYNAANAGARDDTYPSTSTAPAGLSYPLPRAEERQDHMQDLESAIGGLQLWAGPSVTAAAVASRPTPDPASILRRRPAYIAHSQDDSDSLSEISTQTATSHTRPSAGRRRTVQPDGRLDESQAGPSRWQRLSQIYAAPQAAPASTAAPFTQTDASGPSQPPVNTPLGRIARNGVLGQNANRQSFSSWGTVHTADSPQTRGSMSELGLNNFPLSAPGGGARNSIGSLDEIRSNILDDREQLTTPHADSPLLGFAEPSHLRHAHRFSLPGNSHLPSEPPAVEVYNEGNSLHRSHRTNNRQRTVPRRFSTLPVGTSALSLPAHTVPAPADVSEFGAFQQNDAAEFGMRAESPLENALGLDLGALDLGSATPPTITAPTPRHQAATFMRNWSYNDDAT